MTHTFAVRAVLLTTTRPIAVVIGFSRTFASAAFRRRCERHQTKNLAKGPRRGESAPCAETEEGTDGGGGGGGETTLRTPLS